MKDLSTSIDLNNPAFFKEAIRCLMPGGRVIMIEPYAGWIGSWIFRYLHHEGFDKNVTQWKFESHGPVSDADNALPYVIFERDAEKFRHQFPELSIVKSAPHSPLRYWLTGGLRKWSLLPAWAYDLASWTDKMLTYISLRLGSFLDIALVKLCANI